MEEQATTKDALDESNNHREYGAEEAASTDPARAFVQEIASERHARQEMTRRIDNLERTLTTRLAALERALSEALLSRPAGRQVAAAKVRARSVAAANRRPEPRAVAGANPMGLGHRLREARIERNLTQASLAKKIKISSSMISFWETGRAAVPEMHLQALSKALRVSERLLRTGRD